MIDTLLDVLFMIIEAVVSLLPDYTPPNGGMLQSLINALSVFNQYFPIVELTECLVAYFAFSAIYMMVKPILKIGRLA